MLLIFAAVVIVVTGIVLAALDRVGAYANHLDEERSRQAVAGAIETFADQVAHTLNDYADWDDAAAHIYQQTDIDWMRRNIGFLTTNASLFDVAIILDQTGRDLMAYADGVEVRDHVEGYLTPDVINLFNTVRWMSPEGETQKSGFARTSRGLTAVSVALIRPQPGERIAASTGGRYLVFMRHLMPATVEQMARTYALPGLHIADAVGAGRHRVDIMSPSGVAVGALAWTPQSPGDTSLAQVRPLVWCAVAMVAIYFILLFVSGSQALARFRADEAAAVRLSLTDRLSGLANRAGLFAGLATLTEQASREGSDVALLYLDLDGFKEVNDAYGHNTGDRLIRGVSAGLRALVGESAVLARPGGDEFAIAVCAPNAEATAITLCEQILDFFGEPFAIGERVAVIGCSIGLAVSSKGSIPGEEVVRRADMAMYCSKEDGRGRWTCYDPAMDAEREERNLLELDLRTAIERQEITVVFQPVVDAKTLKQVGVEALARWTREGKGPVSPDIFIPIAESTGLIDKLGLCVLRQACMELHRWPELSLAVNVSPGQFRDPAFTDYVEAIFAETGTDPGRITLEMTETYFIQNPTRARATLDRLKKTGVRIALDDFGAGFSSVGYLRQFGFDRLKIDKSLAAAVGEGGRALEMLQATVALARALGIPVTAEGVETEAQAKALRLAGCDLLQGYLFGRPVPAGEISELRHTRRSSV